MPEYRVGRLIDHVHLRVSDLERSARFYVAVLRALDPRIEVQQGDGWAAADDLFLSADGPPTPMHLAFQAEDEEAVRRFYAAYVLDPDCYNIEAVYHGSLTRSAGSVLSPVLRP